MKANEKRKREKWSHYVETKATKEIYDSTKKFKDLFTLAQILDLGVNEGCFYVNQKIDDAFNMLLVKYPEYNF